LKEQRIMKADLESAIDVPIKERRTYTNSYDLEDGTTLELQLCLDSVKRLAKHNLDGTPIYMIATSIFKQAKNIPSELKTKPKLYSYQAI